MIDIIYNAPANIPLILMHAIMWALQMLMAKEKNKKNISELTGHRREALDYLWSMSKPNKAWSSESQGEESRDKK